MGEGKLLSYLRFIPRFHYDTGSDRNSPWGLILTVAAFRNLRRKMGILWADFAKFRVIFAESGLDKKNSENYGGDCRKWDVEGLSGNVACVG